MPSEDLCCVGQGEEDIADGAYDGICVASREVGTAYRSLEESVACPKCILVCTIEAEAARGMTRSMEDCKGVGTELDRWQVGDVVNWWLWWYACWVEVESVHVDTELFVLLLIGHAAFNVELVVTMNESTTHDVIEMEVGTEHVDKFELTALDIVPNSCPFCLDHTSRVDDAGFEGVIADDIAVDHQRIHLKGLDV